MGAWGPGLYSDDYALDLRATVSAVCRLPMDGDQIVDLLTDLEPPAQDQDDDDYPTFWLVIADQLQRRGIASPAQTRALGIIDDGLDLVRCEQLGMSSADLKKRGDSLLKLPQAIATAPLDKPRRTLQKPQPLLMQPGDVYAYPVDSRGNCINPYLGEAQRTKVVLIGWSAFVVLRAEHALGYLTWYQLAPSITVWSSRPTLEQAVANVNLSQGGIGTMSKVHAARMRIERLGTLDPPPVSPPPPKHGSPIKTTASDISLSNLLSRWAPPGTYP